ncbi:FecR family protein [Sphingobacterium sp. UGAL515B_05]|uniref:FecR family protein n=1 Tax=Sphingobacterium sp. UGAL515B_05 TaxID=2986767 RepID=UPI00295557C3|nr:FecR domain-containing protein [Sphingobacterium sp. UGAL515B_05]WON96128.1 FecR domain-containing protein [Sphingobacterium sp. UGAL515B_05]
MAKKIDNIYKSYLEGRINRVDLDWLLHYFEYASDEELERLTSIASNVFEEEQTEQSFAPHIAIVKQRLKESLNKPKNQPIRLRQRLQWWAAASILLVAGLATWFYLGQGPKTTDVTAPSAPTLYVKDKSGKEIAILPKTDSVWQIGDIAFSRIDSQTVKVMALGKNPSLQTIYTPNSDFRLVLEDGTKITMNAASTLKFQVPFDAVKRDVSLDGEGYFEVTHDARRPFTVTAGAAKVEVLGTVFNVRNYASDGHVTTSLLSGRIALSKSGTAERMILRPGETAVTDQKGIHIQHLTPKQAVAWTAGYFDYRDQSLRVILSDLSRWYGVDVDTIALPTDRSIYMKVRKNISLQEMLRLLNEASALDFQLNNKKIVLKTTIKK